MLKSRLGLGRASAAGGGGKWPLSSGLCTAVFEFKKTTFYSAKPGVLKSGSSFSLRRLLGSCKEAAQFLGHHPML